MVLLIDSEIETWEWDKLLNNNPHSSPFQTHSFYELINSIPGLSAKAIAIKDDTVLKVLCVVTFQKESGIKGYFSRRAIIYGGPVIIRKDYKKSLDFLIGYLNKEYKRKTIFIETRNLSDYSVYNEIFIDNGWLYTPYQNIIIECSNREKLLQEFGNNRKRQIKKAVVSGVKVKEAETLDEVCEYYSLLKWTYDNKIKKPLFPKEFFIELLKKNFGKILLVKFKNKIIGGIVCPIYTNKCIYELYICGLDGEYKEQYPSVMATWAAINYANEHQIAFFDFMGAGRKDQSYGVRDFKARFGGTLIENGRYLRINNSILYKVGELGLRVSKKIGR